MGVYRAYQILAATEEPCSALDERFERAYLQRGKEIDEAVGALYEGKPVPPELGVWERVAARAASHMLKGGSWQGKLFYPNEEINLVEGHPDCLVTPEQALASKGKHGFADLKTTPLPTPAVAQCYAYSLQMATYAHYFRNAFGVLPEVIRIVLSSTQFEEAPVNYNKDGSISMQQECGKFRLQEAVATFIQQTNDKIAAGTKKGDKWEPEKYEALVGKTPLWSPIVIAELGPTEIEAVADVGRIFVDFGIQILQSPGQSIVTRPYKGDNI